MRDFAATENDADLTVVEGESGPGSVRFYAREGLTDPENGHAFLRQVSDDSPETTKPVCLFDPNLPAEDLSDLSGGARGG